MTTLAAPAAGSNGLADDVLFSVPSAKVVPILLMADLSSSMASHATDSEGRSQAKIEGLKLGVNAALDYVVHDPVLRHGARLNVVTFNSDVNATGFKAVNDLRLPSLQTAGNTRLAAALQKTIREVERFVTDQNAKGVNFAQATVLLISDGEGTDGPCTAEMRTLLRMQEERLVYLIGAGIDARDADRLTKLGFPTVYTLDRMTWVGLIQTATVSAKRLASGQHPVTGSMAGGN